MAKAPFKIDVSLRPVAAVAAVAAAIGLAGLLAWRNQRPKPLHLYPPAPNRAVVIVPTGETNPPTIGGSGSPVAELRLIETDPKTGKTKLIAVVGDNRSNAEFITFQKVVASPDNSLAVAYSILEVSDGIDYDFHVYALANAAKLAFVNDETVKGLTFGRAVYSGPEFAKSLAGFAAQGAGPADLAAIDYRVVDRDPKAGPQTIKWLDASMLYLGWRLGIRLADEPATTEPFAQELFGLRFRVDGPNAKFLGFSPDPD